MAKPEITLRDAVEKAIWEWLAENSGMPGAFVCAVDWTDGDGVPTLTISHSKDQPSLRSMGLVSYLDEWFRMDCRGEIDAAVSALMTDEETD